MKYSLHINKGIWHVSFYIKDVNGKRKQKCLSTGFKALNGKKEINKRKADEKAQIIIKEYEGLTDCDYVKMTLDKYVADWLNRNKSHISVTTYDRYVSMLNKHITPYFSTIGLTIRDIKPIHLETYCDTKLAEGLSSTTVLKHIGLVSPAFKDAVKNEYIRLNPCEYMDKPKRAKFIPNYYNAEQLKKLICVCKDTPIEVPVILGITLGLRRSEILGLRWSAIDFSNNIININQKVVSAKVDGKLQIVISKELKTDASEDVFVMNDDLKEYLLLLKQKQSEYVRETKEYVDYVCINKVGDLLKPDYVTSKFSDILRQYDLPPIRFHDLRHSCITLLANNKNFSMKQVQAYARHSNFLTTANTYSHVNNDIKKTELDSITAQLGEVLNS